LIRQKRRSAVRERYWGAILTAVILGGVIAILALNVNFAPRGGAARSEPRAASIVAQPPAGFREYPIGDEVERNQMRLSAVWLPPVAMEGMDEPASSSLIHLEADVRATEGNRNGFAKDEFVPYMAVQYAIVPADAATEAAYGKAIRGPMIPMVARDGLHYGATIDMPAPGRFKLTYAFQPPSVGGLGRHADRATGVDPWWKPFEVAFDWDYPGPPEKGDKSNK
jgi:uncharacterized protein involved in high-affinity Fe2+ transport